MAQPSTPPATLAAADTAAYRKLDRGFATESAIWRTSGGIGKNELSANEITASAVSPWGESAQESTQS
jgi:hypothetical protein